jgi:L-lactate dehydrogenase complex protein LldG
MVADAGAIVLSARELVLGRIRAALADVPAAEAPTWERGSEPDPAAAYRLRGEHDDRDLVGLFAERCGEYQARVTRCAGDDAAIERAVAEACLRHSATAVVVAAGLTSAWVPDSLDVKVDEPPLSLAELDAADGVITGCELAIALTGTIALSGGPGQGRRALSLVPDLHVCVVRAEQIVSGVVEAVDALGAAVRDSRAPLTLVSGPSATSDIELERVEGVHGPRRLEVVIAG